MTTTGEMENMSNGGAACWAGMFLVGLITWLANPGRATRRLSRTLPRRIRPRLQADL